MSVARVTGIIAPRRRGLGDAVDIGVTGAWVQDMKVVVEEGKVVKYRVNRDVTFMLTD